MIVVSCHNQKEPKETWWLNVLWHPWGILKEIKDIKLKTKAISMKYRLLLVKIKQY